MTPLQKTHLIVGTVILLSLAAYGYTDSYYALIPALLVSIGLIRAGVTGTCPLTNLLARHGK